MKVELDKPIEVTERQYNYFHRNFSGLIAFRKDKAGKFFIKVMFPSILYRVETILNASKWPKSII